MQHYHFTPGPTQLYPTVEQHMQHALSLGICSLSHRSTQFSKIYQSCAENLRTLLHVPQDWSIFFMGSATEAMERLIQGCVREHSYHLVNGAFSNRFYTIAQELGKQAQKMEKPAGNGFIADEVCVPDQAEVVCVTLSETSTGVITPLETLRQLKKCDPDRLLLVDSVSGVPYFPVDEKGMDALLFSVQKGFSLPAGLGVLMVNPRCLEKAHTLHSAGVAIGSYHSLLSLQSHAVKNQTPETPNILAIYLLDRVCNDLLEIGIAQLRSGIDQKASLLYAALENSSRLRPFVSDQQFRSPSVIVAECHHDQETPVSEMAEQGIYVGRGYGPYKKKHIRIANFPTHTLEQVERLLPFLT